MHENPRRLGVDKHKSIDPGEEPPFYCHDLWFMLHAGVGVGEGATNGAETSPVVPGRSARP